ncbi:MAG: sigma-70 family RNA polymerase sigma factor [Gemmataceae bacterium]
MARASLVSLVERLRHLAGADVADPERDDALLGRFITAADGSAFETLLRRHGGLVMGVCRRVLEDETDAEDAFQATFLVLVRRAPSVRRRGSLASWLYGVALRVAQKAKVAAARRHARDRRAAAMRNEAVSQETQWNELRPVLDQELGKLSEKYRAPLVLCYLEGKTNEEAAALLGWSKGTVSGRLARARELLRNRLQQRGLNLSVAGLAALLTQNTATDAAVAPELLVTTSRAALGDAQAISAPVAALTESVSSSLRLEVWWRAAIALFLLAALGLGVLALRPAGEPSVVYLAEMQQVDLSVPVPDHFEIGATVNGVASPRSLALHPATGGHSTITYQLDGKYRRFESAVGIRDGSKRSRSQAPLTFSVLGDGRLLWTSRPFYEAGETQNCSIAIDGVQRLELRCHCPSWRVYAWMAWVDPRLLP